MKKWRTKSAVVAVIAAWVAPVAALASYLLLVAAYGGVGGAATTLIGLSMAVIAILAQATALISALLAAAKNRERVRAGAIILATIPLALLVYAAYAFAQTNTASDVFGPLVFIYSGIALLISTLLITLPEHLGTR
ncbi:hypothetical protein [Propionimicrobium lymphophilum]|uniref:hypothetical protein n=1 Tax=Propionimicrobium lymphophilum TaxID=33012 RepID=UPI0023F275ED|nr:hypothetical protein [Propionimicrobium lymphophilum]